MTELNIKKEIGKRILEARKAKGLTLKALGELAGGLKQTRLTNWEQGVRTPGPEEIKSLAQALDVSPAYLMCLSDEKQFKEAKSPSQLIPLLDYRQACKVKLYTSEACGQEVSDNLIYISVSTVLLPELSSDAFALKVTDESMKPEISVNDVLVFDPMILPQPGDFVAVKVVGKSDVVIGQYKKLSYTSPDEFELLMLNDNWPNIKFNERTGGMIVGTVVQKIRGFYR
ncbi:TPA: helix-turn-helix domain-containing protein [Legionella pneumophila]|uniref:helix-turn-helix domain-containing protein n=1 Tax=Legionella pneumophila TaxID=446 RepID=UPI001A2BCFA3|nr:helix-turn-helix domain-containing protein [Legionella pneumophila]MCH9086381.1 helix-turn-helix domain-containing protein [Legionella pneumophila serogroup 1]MCH9197564.1 helix-turn-helix domain-containing protein [Legionella pneumophila serogroup 1]MDW9175556.1 helix-turn-helix domain-containing protein [Legionella pneumophila]HAT3883248.1 helix-turn-helix domain-containing protein [Legionella pneumophila]HAU1108877.1 helix-turn-helix domain-containing protein [Legionella pneumophila]